jgi:hypothetical protein
MTTRKEALEEVTKIRRDLAADGLTPKQIQNNPQLKAAQNVLEQAKSAEGFLTTQESLDILNTPGVGPKAADKRLAAAAATKAAGLTTDDTSVSEWGDSGGGNKTDTNAAYLQFLKDQAALGVTERQQTARVQLEVLLRQFFFGADASFVDDALAAAEGDIKSGLPTLTILLKMQNYDDPNSLFSRRFAGNVKLKQAGIEPLDPATYLAQEQRYREALSTRGLGDLATRANFAEWVGGKVSPFELEDRVVKVFDIYDGADSPLKSELQATLGLDPLATRTAVAKALLMGEKGATELQRQVRTAEVGVEARTRGLETTRAEELARMGVTREQARAGFETIGRQLPRTEFLSSIYQQDSQDLQTELEQEQFQGMLSQRRKKALGREISQFSRSSGLSGSALSQTPTAGQV